MAETVISSIVDKVVDLLVVPVGKHICYPFKYKSNMEELKEQVENLTAARDRVQHSIEEAERQRHEIENDVKNWLNSVDEFTEEVVKNIIGSDDDEDKENKAKKLCSIGFCPNLMARYSLSKKAEKTAKVGVDFLKEGKFEKVSYCPDIQRTSSIYIRGYNDFDSRTSIFQDIMQTLADDNFNIIGVHGMGGVGKTTLVKGVVGKAIDDKLFDVVVMADVTQTPDIQKIQAQIADVLSLKLEEESLPGRAARLRDRLKKEKRILLVLDDLWKKLDLQDVGIPFGEGGNAEQRQCKLLLTSRDLHVLRDHMSTQKNFQLKILTDEEAGNLFWQIVGDSAKTSDFHTTGVEIIRRCAGLPVAIATIASALKNQDHFAWEDALDQLKKYNPRPIEGMEANVYSAIKWSYDFLRSEEAKSVFLLCSLYNASFNIDIDSLLQYCIGLGVFQGVSTMEQARNRLQTIINKLKASHLLLNGNTNMCVKLHDIVHAVATSIASEDKLMYNIQDVTDLQETLEVKLPKNSTAMSLPFKDVSELPERLRFPKLELIVLLMTKNSLQIPDPFFEGMEGLKVIHLNNIHMLSLPSSLCRLTSLQTLRLNRCLLGDIAVIGALKRIEILSFIGSTIEQLPGDLSQLTRLRLLDLRNCSNLKVISPNLISSLTRLEELYIGDSFVQWDVEGRSNASLAELKELSRLKRLDICVLDARIIPQDLLIFEKLESYRIYIGDVWNRHDHFNYFESSRMLKLKLNDSNIYLGNDFRLLWNRAEDLCLDELKGVKNVVCQLDGEGFPQLKYLYVRNDPEIQYIISAIGRDLCNVFPKLELLILNKLVNLKKICHGQLPPESFNKLRIMKVTGCDTLNHLFSFSMVKNLSQLQEIEVTDCKKLEVIIFKESEEQVHQNDRISGVEFTQLRTLTLGDLPRLTSFMSLFSQNVAFKTLDRLPKLLHLWKEDSQPRIFFENLTNLNVSDCESLKTLVPSLVLLEKLTTLTVTGCNGLMNLMTLSTAKTLVQLKEITIEDCNMLEEIITDVGDEEIRTVEAEKDAAIDKITLSMLNSITLDRLPNLITFHSGSNTLECPSLTDIYIIDCPKMKAFVFPDDMKDHSIRSASLFNEKVAFPCLKELRLKQLHELLHLWKEDSQPRMFFENLRNLDVSFCENLKTLGPSLVLLEKLTTLSVTDCNGLMNLMTLSTAKTLVQLKKITVEDCNMLEEIITDVGDEEIRTVEAEKDAAIDKITLSMLNSITLDRLPNLITFHSGSNTLECPSLTDIYIIDCPKMEAFVFPDDMKDPSIRSASLFNEKVAFPCLKELRLAQLHKLLHLWKEDSQPRIFFENLTNLNVSYCENLKTLGPSLVLLEKLTTLTVTGCNGLMNLMTLSTAKTLVQLQTINITECKMLQEIITDVGDEEIRTAEAEKDAAIDKITLSMLNSITLDRLPNLITFHSGSNTLECPSLTYIFIQNCPQMEAFVFPDDMKDPSIRSASLFNEKAGFPSLEKMVISGMDNLESIWHSQFLGDSFYNLKSVEVNDCEELMTIFPSCICERLLRLESLTVKSCGSVIEIFDLRGINLKEKHSIQTTPQLRELYVDHMSNLKHIWNEDPKGVLSFEKLEKVTVFLCPTLENLFPASVAKSLLNLDSLEVSDCGVEEIIAKGGGVKEAAGSFLFPKLSSLQLHNLPRLRTFYPGHTVEGPCLKRLGLHHCDKVKLFISEFLGFYRTIEIEGTNQGFPNLEELKLSGKAMTTEWLDQIPENVFGSLKSLELDDDESTVLPLDFNQRFGSLEKLSLNSSSYKEIISYGKVKEHPEIKHLVLSGLFDLKQIWKQGSKIHLNFQNLEILEVRSCFNLINLMPSSASFQNLMILEVWGCDGLKNLLTSSTAKSLVLLEKLEVFDCKILTEVVANEGAVPEEIVFGNLKSLSLVYLQSLASFCSTKHILNFPILESLVVNECPKMKIFSEGVMSTPKLYKLELNWKAIEQSWEVGVNTTIQQNMEKRLLGREDCTDPSTKPSELADSSI